MRLTMRRETCPTCAQQIVPPTPSKVVLVRVAMAAFAVGSGLIEYRRTVRRELEQQRLEQLHETSPDVPLDEHLDQREPHNPFDVVRQAASLVDPDDGQQADTVTGATIQTAAAAPRIGIEATPWPPAHPSLADEHDASEAEQ